MATMIKYMTAILSLLLVCACTRLGNSVEHISIICGEYPATGKRFIKVKDWDRSPFEAVVFPTHPLTTQFHYDQRFTPRITARNCIELSTEFNGVLALRKDEHGQMLTISPGTEFQNQVTGSALIAQADIISCPGKTLYTNESLEPRVEKKSFVTAILPYYSTSIQDPHGKQQYGTSSHANPVVDFHTPGAYQVTFSTWDAFNPNKGQTLFPETCEVNYDPTTPTLTTDLDTYQRGQQDEFHLLPQNNAFKLQGTDNGVLTFHACLKKRKSTHIAEDCESNEYRTIEPTIQAPADGIWDLRAYAEDQAGNRSEILERSFAVFHDKDLVQLQGLEIQISEELRDGKVLAASSTFREALEKYRGFELTEERDALESTLLTAAASLQFHDQIESQHSERIGLNVATTSPDGKRIALHEYLNRRLTIWDPTLRLIFSQENVVGFTWIRDGAYIVDDEARLFKYKEGGVPAYISTLPDLAFVRDPRRSQIRISVDPTSESVIALANDHGARVFSLAPETEPQRIWTWNVQDRNSRIEFSSTGTFVAYKGGNLFQVIDYNKRQAVFQKTPETDASCRVHSFQFSPENLIFASLEPKAENSCPAIIIIGVWNGEFTSEDMLVKFNIQNELSGPYDLSYLKGSRTDLLLAFEKGKSNKIQYFSLTHKDGLKLTSKGIVQPRSQGIIHDIVIDSPRHRAVLTKDDSFEFFHADDIHQLADKSIRIARQGPSEAVVLNPIKIINTNENIQLYDLEQGFLGTRYMAKARDITSQNLQTIQFEDLHPVINRNTLEVLTYDGLTRELKLSDGQLKTKAAWAVDFVPTALDHFKGEFYVADLDGRIYVLPAQGQALMEVVNF
ncbi:WD40 repeat domain-containing protein [Oligoflexus tunisiensis]|uniref:WD40 repeat domain-containing protein n=1 Tax=Oligoflexus tunisiensis TaxID=708132 RepID=UPI00114CE719|nr:WD40 repeat domain-containing protein [Oligoflexus tunisiensis]